MINKKIHIKIRALLFLLTICSCLSILTFSVRGSEDPAINVPSSAKAYAVYLYNVETDSPLFEKNISKKISPASTVKLMTAIVAVENIKDVSQNVTITSKMLGDIESNTMKLKVGEIVKIEDLFWGMVCSGYNDAANALAVIAKGSVANFVDAMNTKATELGATDTVYVDPTGINDSAQTTAYDTMLIAKAFISTPMLLEISSSTSKEISATNMSEKRALQNRNALISNRSGSKYLNSSAIGMNAGMTNGGGYCVVTSAKKENMTYICVVMGAKYDEDSDTVYSYVIANELLSYISKHLGYRTVLSSKDEIASLPLLGATINKTSVSIIAKEDVRVYLPLDYLESGDFNISYVYNKNKLVAPVCIGDTVGKIVVRYGTDIVFVTDMVVAEDVPRNGFMYAVERTRSLVFGRGFIAAIICFVVLFVCHILFERGRFYFIRKRIKKSISRYR